MRTIVVGASSGLGRCIGVGLANAGGEVALLARRRDRIERAAEEAGEHAVAVTCDVTDVESCRAAVAEAAVAMGGVDGLVYAPGIGPLGALLDVDADVWRRVFDTNVTGAALVTAAAMPHLEASNGTAIYLSSVSASLTPPWPGLGPYAVSKAALDKLVDALRAEHPGVAFTRLVVGDSGGGEGEGGTEFSAGWDPDEAARFGPMWVERNLLSGGLLDVDDLVRTVHTLLSLGPGASVTSLTLTPKPAEAVPAMDEPPGIEEAAPG